MRLTHTVVYRLRGIALPENLEHEVLRDDAAGVVAVLTADIDRHLEDPDRAGVLAGRLLRRLVGQPSEGTLDDGLQEAVAEVRRGRQQKYSAGPYLLFVRQAPFSEALRGAVREMDKVEIAIGAIDKDAVRAASVPHLRSLLSAVFLSAVQTVGVDKVLDSILLRHDDGRPIYIFTVSMGAADVYVSRPLDAPTLETIPTVYARLLGATQLERVSSLMVAAMDTEADRLRSFLASWTALEMFINKLFPEYESLLFDELTADGRQVRRDYWYRIKQVMKDKYRLSDKFVLIAAALSPDTADADTRAFRQAKKTRDDLLHGFNVADQALEAEPVLQILRRYLGLRLHGAAA